MLAEKNLSLLYDPLYKYNYKATVEFEDVDSYGIAHHSRLINYLERARVHYLAGCGLSVADPTFALVVAEMNIKFMEPVRLLEEITVSSSIRKLSQVSLFWDYDVVQEQRMILHAEVKLASVDPASKKLRPMPAAHREALAALVQP